MISQKRAQGPDEIEEKMLNKPNITPSTLEEKKKLQTNHALGGSNIYFELNRIYFENDQKRRQDQVKTIHDFTQNSPLKNHTL